MKTGVRDPKVGEESAAAEIPDRTFAPVVLFVHSRLDHTRRTLEALARNDLAKETDLYIYSDAARPDRRQETEAVAAVRAYIGGVQGFRSVTVIEREDNLGLAGSITLGVSAVMAEHGHAIVLEDDIVTSPCFLSYMNLALDRYRNTPGVWHVNGWTYEIETQPDNGAFLTPVMECWGWASWSDRWQHFNADPKTYLGKWDRKTRARFNVGGGYDYMHDIRRNAQRTIRTWAVFWYATIFSQGGLCLSPARSYAVNIGIDGSGVNSGGRDIYAGTRLSTELPIRWPAEIVEDVEAWRKTRDFLLSQRAPLWRRMAQRLKWQIRRLRPARAR